MPVRDRHQRVRAHRPQHPARHRTSRSRKDIEVVAINDLGPVADQCPSACATIPSMAGFPHEVTGRRRCDRRAGPEQASGSPRCAIRRRCRGQGARRRHRARMHRHLHGASDKASRASGRRGQARASSRRRPTGPTSPSSTASTIDQADEGPSRSSRTPPAPPIAWRRWPRCCTTPSASRRGFMTTIHCLHQRPALARHRCTSDLYRARAAGAVDDPDFDRGGQG